MNVHYKYNSFAKKTYSGTRNTPNEAGNALTAFQQVFWGHPLACLTIFQKLYIIWWGGSMASSPLQKYL